MRNHNEVNDAKVPFLFHAAKRELRRLHSPRIGSSERLSTYKPYAAASSPHFFGIANLAGACCCCCAEAIIMRHWLRENGTTAAPAE